MPDFLRQRFTAPLLTLAGLTLATSTMAVQPQQFVVDTEADFTAGTLDGVTVNQFGDLTLAPSATTLSPQGDTTVIYDAQQLPDGTTYLAAGPQGQLMQLTEDGLEPALDLEPGQQVFALDQLNGRLLLAISSGDGVQLATLADAGLSPLIQLPEERYAWDLLVDGLLLYVATGTDGKVIQVDLAAVGEPSTQVVLDTPQDNILCLAQHPATGAIYAGTDADGLVWRIDNLQAEPTGFVVLDAAEPEIGSLLFVNGTLYAGTADANEARPDTQLEAADEDTGRPEAPFVDEPVEAADPVDPDAEDAGDLEALNGAVEAELDTQPEDGAAAPEPVSQDDRDRLREVVRQRLSDARESGSFDAPAGSEPGNGGDAASGSGPLRAAPQQAEGGNAIYAIDADGFVTELFREEVMILKLVAEDHNLLVATGNAGQLFRIDPRTAERTLIYDGEANQITTALLTADGGVLVATANPAAAVRLDAGPQTRGSFTSLPQDCGQVSLLGAMRLYADVPEGGTLLVQTRSGNVADPNLPGWSTWSDEQAFVHDGTPSIQPRQMTITSPPGRYVQVRVSLLAADDNTPTLEKLEGFYITPNIAPQVSSVTAAYPETGQGSPEDNELPLPESGMDIEWEATDANADRLLYTLAYQPAGSDRWVTLAEDVADSSFNWDTRRVPDGRYTLRVTAHDTPDNPAESAQSNTRRSSAVIVDNTPPSLLDVAVTVNGTAAVVTGQAVEGASWIAGLAYALDAQDSYHQLLPEDLIADSTQESFRVTLPDLAPGPHVVTIRALDARGHARYEAVLFNID